MHYWFYELKFSRFRDILYAVMRPKQTNKKSSLRFLVVFSIWHWRMLVRECKKVLPRCPTHLCHCEPSQMAWQSSKLCTHAIACDFIMTGSPRSLRSLARIKSTAPSSPLWRGAAQRRGGSFT